MLLLSSNANAQCSFERFWPYYPSSTVIGIQTLLLNDGGYLLYGASYPDTLNWGMVGADLIMVKSDSCGNTLWTNIDGYEGDGEPDMQAIETDSGNFLVVGYTAAGLPGAMGNTRVGKYNKDGKLVKEKLFAGIPSSSPVGIIKLKNKHNRYYIYELGYNGVSGILKPIIVEIDADLNIIRSKVFEHQEFSSVPGIKQSGIGNILEHSVNRFGMLCGVGTVTWGISYYAEMDSLFNITNLVQITTDSLEEFGCYTNQLFWGKDSLSIEGAGRFKTKDMPYKKEFFFRMDLNGKLILAKLLQQDITITTCLSPTSDGGYIAGHYIQKLDSNFNTEWVNKVRGGMRSLFQLKDGSYVGSGLSGVRTKKPDGSFFYEMYLVKTDSAGIINRTGIKEQSATKFNRYVYPNPNSSGIFTLSGTHTQPYTVKVTDATGKQILHTTIYNGTIDVSGNPNGMYYIRIEDVDGNLLLGQSILLVD